MSRFPPKHSHVMLRLGALLEAGGWKIENGEVIRPEWHSRAACRGVGTGLFFPEHRSQVYKAYAEARERYCDHCPVVVECIEAGRHEDHGLWGGCSERERTA